MQQSPPNPFLTAQQSYAQSTKRILVIGPPGTGKTTFSVSASKFAGNKITGEVRQCTDVALFQGDAEGVMGACDAGFEGVRVLPLDNCTDWREYGLRVKEAVQYLVPLVQSGEVTTIVVDMAHPQRLCEAWVKPQDPQGYAKMRAEGLRFYGLFSPLEGAIIIGNAQLKSQAVWAKKDKAKEAKENANTQATGGELSAFGPDLTKGIGVPWKENCSFIFVREAGPKRDESGDMGRRFVTVTQNSQKYEAKSRANSILPAKMAGDITLRAILNRVYNQPRSQEQPDADES